MKTAFVADKDTWLFTAIPETFAGVIWTEGYSIENDVYAGSRIEELLDVAERSPHRELLRNVIRWFAYEVELCRSGEEAQFGRKLAEVVPLGGLAVDPTFLARRNFQEPAATTID